MDFVDLRGGGSVPFLLVFDTFFSYISFVGIQAFGDGPRSRGMLF